VKPYQFTYTHNGYMWTMKFQAESDVDAVVFIRDLVASFRSKMVKDYSIYDQDGFLVEDTTVEIAA
jgi:hypothetical protein